jgi:hypothetical protein
MLGRAEKYGPIFTATGQVTLSSHRAHRVQILLLHVGPGQRRVGGQISRDSVPQRPRPPVP